MTNKKNDSSKTQSKGYTIRKAQTTDVYDIAEILYGTDPFIYPTAFKNKEGAREHFSVLINLKGSAYYYENIDVAVNQNGKIVGAICSYDRKIDKNMDYSFFLNAEDKKTKHVCKEYFNQLYSFLKSDEEYYILALCVDQNYRKEGIGELLLNAVLTEKHDKIITLDVICDNQTAVSLYQKLGFIIEGESYKGYAYLSQDRPDCYCMIKRP